jgi:hypothetical protein
MDSAIAPDATIFSIFNDSYFLSDISSFYDVLRSIRLMDNLYDRSSFTVPVFLKSGVVERKF